jgi:hypothetical protein
LELPRFEGMPLIWNKLMSWIREDNVKLQYLNIHTCGLNDHHGIILADIMTHHRSLTSLILCGNLFTEATAVWKCYETDNTNDYLFLLAATL